MAKRSPRCWKNTACASRVYGKAGVAVRLSVPIHGNRPLKAGLLKHFLKQAGLGEGDLGRCIAMPQRLEVVLESFRVVHLAICDLWLPEHRLTSPQPTYHSAATSKPDKGSPYHTQWRDAQENRLWLTTSGSFDTHMAFVPSLAQEQGFSPSLDVSGYNRNG